MCVELNVMLIQHTDDPVRLSLFLYFFKQPQNLSYTLKKKFQLVSHFFIVIRTELV